MATIYVDLDGTVVDVADRYWALHSHLTDELGGPALTRARYWKAKRQGMSIGNLWPSASQSQQQRYSSLWLERIEQPNFLALDRLIDGALDALNGLNKSHRIVLATMRRNRQTLLAQLETLTVRAAVDDVLMADDTGMTKHGLIDGDPKWVRDRRMVVGDTEIDIAAGRSLAVPTVAVLSGLRNRDVLAKESPNFLIDSIVSLPNLVESTPLLSDAHSSQD